MEEMNLNPAAGAAVQPVDNAPALKKAASRYGWALVELVTVTTVLQLVFSAVFAMLPSLAAQPWALWVMTFVPEFCVAFPLLYLIVRKMPAKAPEAHTPTVGAAIAAFCCCETFLMAGNLIGTGLSSLLSGGAAENPLGAYVSETSFFSILVVVILAPIVEELMFRKLMIDRLAPFGKWTAILVSSLCFALFHTNLYQFFYAFGIGIVLGCVYMRTGNTLYNILMHMAVNLMGSVIAVWAVGKLSTGTGFGIAVFAVYAVLLYGMVIAGIVLMIVKRKKYLVFDAASQQVQHGVRTGMLTPGMIVFTVCCVAFMVVMLALPTILAAIA